MSLDSVHIYFFFNHSNFSVKDQACLFFFFFANQQTLLTKKQNKQQKTLQLKPEGHLNFSAVSVCPLNSSSSK